MPSSLFFLPRPPARIFCKITVSPVTALLQCGYNAVTTPVTLCPRAPLPLPSRLSRAILHSSLKQRVIDVIPKSHTTMLLQLLIFVAIAKLSN
ncbi:unnamed protein product [Chondrus crispus]|uniref:Uncharacterized protein n=1 Tax=Chondrus crispus TaxID=2769 RepID=R7QPN8_CHOCR|nr:unnamed protein product [Chondrus crispus]CDF40447.1 unnamed protein product [Chondrus crispus]|eukprot:XP_005710741.1 unnamed protein product [Chondrus crispus]